jgi:Predicted transcriptional regulator with C-terminal CBS domains
MSQRHQTLTRFGLNVRRRREAIGLSQEALAEKAALDRTYISGIERGTRNPTILSAARVAAALKTSLAQLVNGVSK